MKGVSPAAAKKNLAKSINGAPSQHNQSSRKGKRAWRKNVDIQDLEEAIEGLRAEERVVGTTLQKLTNEDLFTIDVQGDAQIRKSLPKFSTSLLTSTKILSQRSAVPAVFSRPPKVPTTVTKRKFRLTAEDKDRLLRIAKRPRQGPFNSIIDPTQPGEGSALGEISAAVKAGGTYDPWALRNEDEDELIGMETVKKRPVKPPPAFLLKSVLSNVPAVPLPHQGTSYNPPVGSHQELLRLALSAEEKRITEEQKGADVKERMENAGVVRVGGIFSQVDHVPSGMLLDVAEAEGEKEGLEDEDEALVKKIPRRKTKAQRNKAARLLAEKRAQATMLAKKRLLASISSVKCLSRAHVHAALRRTQQIAAKRATFLERLRKSGLAGKKLGKYKVPEERIDVQLGEDLSESFRALKPEGNLFRDRFLRLQQRGAVEPRVLVLPKKRRKKTIEYEKHAWKRFE